MALIHPLIQHVEGNSLLVSWTGIGKADTCAPFANGAGVARSVQVTGSFGGDTTLDIEGSNVDDDAAYVALTNDGITPIQFSDEGFAHVFEASRFIRPVIVGDDDATLDVHLLVGAR